MANAVTGGMRGPARVPRGPGRVFGVAVGLSCVMALLPAGALRPWIGDVASLVWLPLRPGEHLLASFRRVLRPEPESQSAADQQLLVEQRDRFRALWHAERLRREEAEQRLAKYERAEQASRGGDQVDPLIVTVLGPGPGPGGRVLTLAAGRNQGVSVGDPAVIGGDRLVGRVTGEPAPITCWLTPITDPSLGRLDVYVTPADRPEAAPGEGVRAQLRADGRGLLVGEVDVAGRVTEGDVVRLDDRQWKRAAQGMRVGVVRAVRRADRNPLRSVIEVEPGLDLAQEREVTLRLEATP